jgi:hypothetical protein
MTAEAARLEKLIEKYKFTKPIPDSAREKLIKSRSRVFKSALKEVGEYSIWFALIVYFFFKLRSIGLGSSIAAAKIAAVVSAVVAAAVIASGSYATYRYLVIPDSGTQKQEEINQNTDNSGNTFPPVEENISEPESGKQVQNRSNDPVYEIRLYNGRVYRGVILSRGKSYVVSTPGGQVVIPSKQIRIIRRAK